MFYSKKISGLVDGGSMNVDEGVETVSSLKPSPAGVLGTSPRSSGASSTLSDDAFSTEVDATVKER